MVKLRTGGRRLTAAELRGRPRLVGLLRVAPEPEARHAARSERAAMLLPADGGLTPVAELHGVRLHSVDERGMVLTGVEETFNRKQRAEHRQAWWCWPVDPARHAASQAPDPIDEEEEREQLAVLALGADQAG